MTMLATDRTMIWVNATLAVALLPQLQRMPLPVALMCLAPLVWRFAYDLYGWKPLRPIIRYSGTLLALAVLAVSFGEVFGRRASVSLLAVMLALKLLECERVRDARIVVSFSLFLCVTQFLFSQTVIMPFYGAATLVIGLVALTRLQRRKHSRTPTDRLP